MKKICVVTGTRAEFGLLYWLLKEIEADKELQLQVIVTGMHLSPEFGLTYKEIEKEFKINKKIEMLLSSFLGFTPYEYKMWTKYPNKLIQILDGEFIE
jgi:GDP/UDP-N,N'-diacetylbacillosamine 2-epimerase (hydrolysing)